MKGPRSRHRFNVLRVWECPNCRKRVFAPPQVTTVACACSGTDGTTWMCLIEPSRVRAVKPSGDPV